MDDLRTKRLATIGRKLRELAQELDDLVADHQIGRGEVVHRPKARDIIIDETLVEEIRKRGREDAKIYFNGLSHKQLGSILRALGGPSEETKRSKVMITERILYRMFDYAAGHQIIKGETGQSQE